MGCGKGSKGVLHNLDDIPIEYLPSRIKSIHRPEESTRKKKEKKKKSRDIVVNREMFPKGFSENGKKYPANLLGCLGI